MVDAGEGGGDPSCLTETLRITHVLRASLGQTDFSSVLYLCSASANHPVYNTAAGEFASSESNVGSDMCLNLHCHLSFRLDIWTADIDTIHLVHGHLSHGLSLLGHQIDYYTFSRNSSTVAGDCISRNYDVAWTSLYFSSGEVSAVT